MPPIIRAGLVKSGGALNLCLGRNGDAVANFADAIDQATMARDQASHEV